MCVLIKDKRHYSRWPCWSIVEYYKTSEVLQVLQKSCSRRKEVLLIQADYLQHVSVSNTGLTVICVFFYLCQRVLNIAVLGYCVFFFLLLLLPHPATTAVASSSKSASSFSIRHSLRRASATNYVFKRSTVTRAQWTTRSTWRQVEGTTGSFYVPYVRPATQRCWPNPDLKKTAYRKPQSQVP